MHKRTEKQIKTKSNVSGYTIRGAAYPVLFLLSVIALTSAFNSPDRSQSATGVSDRTAKAASQPTALTFAERVAFQRTIEDVYWRHRIWRKENDGRKPSLDALMWRAQVEKKVQKISELFSNFAAKFPQKKDEKNDARL